MKIGKKILGGAATAVLVTLGALALPSAAQAHTGDMSVTAECNTNTGEYDFTVMLSTRNSPLSWSTKWRVGNSSFQGTPNSDRNMDRGPVTGTGAQTVLLGTFSLPGTATGKGPWVYAHTTWSDGYKQGSDGQLLTNLDGQCQVPPPVQPEKPESLTGSEDRMASNECVVPEDGRRLVKTESRSWTQDWAFDEDAWEWVLQDKDWTEWTLTSEEFVTDETCKPSQPEVLYGSEQKELEPVCVVPLDGTARVSTEERSWSQSPVFDSESWSWVYGDKEFTEWAEVSSDLVNLDSCIPPKEEPKEEPKETPKEPKELPNTGGSNMAGFGLLAGLLLLGGATTSLLARRG